MDRRTFGLAALMMVLGALPLGCANAWDDARTYRYRLTVEVETPEGLRTGSSVIQVIGDEASKYALSPGRLTYRIFGEAVAVDLPNGKKMFALLSMPNGTADDAARYAPIAYAAPYFKTDYPRQLAQWLKKQRDVAVLPPHDPRDLLQSYTEGNTTVKRIGPLPLDPEPYYYPMLVTFGNLNDSKTVVAVDARHLDRTFGPGFKLRRITVATTNLPVTRVLEQRLPWIVRLKDGGYLRGKFDGSNPKLNLGWVDLIGEQK